MIELKVCTTCNDEFEATTDNFRRQSKNKDGLKYTCKDCDSKRAKKRYEENSEELIEQQQQYNKRNKESYQNYQKSYQKTRKARKKVMNSQKEKAKIRRKEVVRKTVNSAPERR